MHTFDTLAYKTADMPQHLDSVMAIAFSPLLSPSILAEIIGHLDKLQNPDFEIANNAYLAIRDEKKQGRIMDYTIADSHWQALAQLQHTMAAKEKPKVKAMGAGYGIFPLLRRQLNINGLKWFGLLAGGVRP